ERDEFGTLSEAEMFFSIMRENGVPPGAFLPIGTKSTNLEKNIREAIDLLNTAEREGKVSVRSLAVSHHPLIQMRFDATWRKVISEPANQRWQEVVVINYPIYIPEVGPVPWDKSDSGEIWYYLQIAVGEIWRLQNYGSQGKGYIVDVTISERIKIIYNRLISKYNPDGFLSIDGHFKPEDESCSLYRFFRNGSTPQSASAYGFLPETKEGASPAEVEDVQTIGKRVLELVEKEDALDEKGIEELLWSNDPGAIFYLVEWDVRQRMANLKTVFSQLSFFWQEANSVCSAVMGGLTDERKVEGYLADLTGEDRNVFNFSAYEDLVKMGKSAEPALVAMLNDGKGYVKTIAYELLGKIGGRIAALALVEMLIGSDGDAAYDTLVKIGKPAVPALVAKLSDGDRNVRRVACELLGEIGDKSAVPALVERLSDGDVYVREAAYGALARMGELTDERRAKRYLADLRDGDRSVYRVSTYDSLVKIGKPAVPALIENLSDEKGYVRSVVCELLGKIG
ncbi:MAG: HEAT repeat domain-containing protein, partial [Candidatus Omnitrophota bacterium]